MSSNSPTSLKELQAYLDDVPERLGVWRPSTAADPFDLLAWVNARPFRDQREMHDEIGPVAFGILGSQHHNQAAISADWIRRFFPSTSNPAHVTPSQDRDALWSLAGKYWSLTNLVAEAKAGCRGFGATGTRISMPYQGVNHVDALDRLLDTTDQMFRLTGEPPTIDAKTQAWMRSNAPSTNWQETPDWVRDGLRHMVAKIMDRLPRFMPMSEQVDGVFVRDIHAFWIELWAMSFVAVAGLWDSGGNIRDGTPTWVRREFLDLMAQGTGVDRSAIERITEWLTMDNTKCPDPALTPLVPIGDSLVLLPALILPGSPHRNTISIFTHRPELFGKIGKLLGDAGEDAVMGTLDRMCSDVLVARRVSVRRPDRSPAGDIDIAICEPATKMLVTFEVSWRLPVDGNAEFYKTAQIAHAKVDQVLRVMAEIGDGEATPIWPYDWPDPGSWRWRRYVITRDVIPNPRPDDHLVGLRSHQLMKYRLPADASVQDLISALDEFPTPPVPLLQTQWRRVRYGDLRFDVESLVGA